jgi:hypothetical protein
LADNARSNAFAAREAAKAKPRGRPPVQIDLEELKKLTGLGCTDEEIASWFQVDRKTISRRKREKAFLAAMELGKAQGRVSIRRALFQMAQQNKQGSAAAAIFLAKHLLGYRDTGLPGTEEVTVVATDAKDATAILREIYGLPPSSQQTDTKTDATTDAAAPAETSALSVEDLGKPKGWVQ